MPDGGGGVELEAAEAARQDRRQHAAFEAFYGDHAEVVLAVVLALRGPSVGAEDVVQEAFLRAHQRWEQVAAMDRPDLWVQRVALNLATSQLRRLGSEARALVRLAGRRHEPVTEAFVREQGFWDAVRRLPAKQGRVVALRYAGDLTVAEVAEVVGVAEGTVKAQLHAARQRLAVLLAEREDGR